MLRRYYKREKLIFLYHRRFTVQRDANKRDVKKTDGEEDRATVKTRRSRTERKKRQSCLRAIITRVGIDANRIYYIHPHNLDRSSPSIYHMWASNNKCQIFTILYVPETTHKPRLLPLQNKHKHRQLILLIFHLCRTKHPPYD